MKINHLITAVAAFLIGAGTVRAQSLESSFEFLRLPVSAHNSSLGGKVVYPGGAAREFRPLPSRLLHQRRGTHRCAYVLLYIRQTHNGDRRTCYPLGYQRRCDHYDLRTDPRPRGELLHQEQK